MLDRLTAGRRRVVTEAILGELDRGRAEHPALADVRALPWLEVVTTGSPAELVVFNEYIRILGSVERNIGEASLLAWAEVTSSAAIVMDDDDAVTAARRRKKVTVLRTLTLLCNGLHGRLLTVDAARVLVDELVTTGGARFPCDGSTFVQWAERNGLLPAS